MIKEQIVEGNIQLGEGEDELSRALGKKEHSGRVRAAGYGVSVKKFFGKNKTRNSSSQEVVKLQGLVSTLLDRVDAMEKREASRVCSQCSQQELATPHQVSHSGGSQPIVADDICSMRESPPPSPPPELPKVLTYQFLACISVVG